MADYYPHEIVKQHEFVSNFDSNIGASEIDLGVPKDTFKVAHDSAKSYLTAYDDLAKARKVVEDLRKKFVKQQKQTEKDIREAAKQIKGIINVPTKVLTDLELQATPEDTQAKAAAQAPKLKMSVVLGVVKGAYTKYKHQGVDVYCCRTGETDFTYLGRFNLNRFQDPRPNRVAGQPEQRDYYAVYVDKDQQVGEQSGTVSVVVGSRPG